MPQTGILTVALDNRKALKSKPSLDTSDEIDIFDKIVVITGANSGLGAAAALEIAKRGAIVVMCCRDIVKANKVVEDIKLKVPDAKLELVALDLGSLESVRTAVEEVKSRFPHINILINNAGVMLGEKVMSKTKDGFEINMGINHLGHFLWTNLLLDHVRKGAPGRIVFLSSMGHQFADLNMDDLMSEKRGPFGPDKLGAYANSKLANMYTVKSLAKMLKDDGINTYALCPGHVNTELNRDVKGCITKKIVKTFDNIMGVPAEEGVTTTVYCALSNHVANETGLMYRHNGLWENAMEKATNDETERQLWEKSAELVGLKA